MPTFDHDLFLALNFDGGPLLDRTMLAASGVWPWILLYALILWIVGRRYGWRGLAVFLLLMTAAVGLADIVAGIFKHSGLLGGLLPDFAPRPRPMFTPALEGLDITPDSLRILRRLPSESLTVAGYADPWAVHVVSGAIGGRFGTVSAHAATNTALAFFAAAVIGRRWFTCLIVVCTALICYSRIYLAMHFPFDILWGVLLGLFQGAVATWIYRRSIR